ncbi:hypothetical protein DERP_010553 [Dermatophagoides pteronyssinus]|uniref:Uncharacterized protein n=1 Tax=Dermatophagoides pteronyssinus TaxID=6956 RepID=A0ABQ8JFK9_DERPT|nr:hypothetical protein DERP_010553 [Dermatophagoides pteronyssinus]
MSTFVVDELEAKLALVVLIFRFDSTSITLESTKTTTEPFEVFLLILFDDSVGLSTSCGATNGTSIGKAIAFCF